MSIPANERNIGMILGKCDVKSEWDKESGIVYQFQEVAEYIKDNYRCKPDLEIIYECLGFWYNDNLHYGVYHDGDTEYDCVLYDDLGCDFLNYPYSESGYHNLISIIYIDENNKIIMNDVSFSSLMIEGYLMEDDEGVVCRWTKKDGWVSVYSDTDDEDDEIDDEEKCEECGKTEKDCLDLGMEFNTGCLSTYYVTNKVLCPDCIPNDTDKEDDC